MKKKILDKIVVLIEILLLWELGSLAIQKACLPAPFSAIQAMLDLIAQGTIVEHIADSAKRIILGTFFGLLLSMPVGLMLGYLPKFDKYLGSLFNFLYTIPKVVFLPVIIVLLGIGDLPKIFLIALVLFFQQAVVIRDSAKNISPELSKSIEVWGATKFQIMCHLVIPSCLPDVMTSLRMSLGTSIALLFITENFASVTGLGYFITSCMDRRNYEEMYAAIILLALLGSILYLAVGLLEHKLCYWKVLEQKTKS